LSWSPIPTTCCAQCGQATSQWAESSESRIHSLGLVGWAGLRCPGRDLNLVPRVWRGVRFGGKDERALCRWESCFRENFREAAAVDIGLGGRPIHLHRAQHQGAERESMTETPADTSQSRTAACAS
jgi:hypothetical protein